MTVVLDTGNPGDIWQFFTKTERFHGAKPWARKSDYFFTSQSRRFAKQEKGRFALWSDLLWFVSKLFPRTSLWNIRFYTWAGSVCPLGSAMKSSGYQGDGVPGTLDVIVWLLETQRIRIEDINAVIPLVDRFFSYWAATSGQSGLLRLLNATNIHPSYLCEAVTT